MNQKFRLITILSITATAFALSACNTSNQETTSSANSVQTTNSSAPSAPAGYTTTSSGLGYKVLKKGSGKSPKATDKVTVHYEGKLTNGEIFDSSYQRGEPASFPLNRVISGWTEGLQLMQEGDKYEFYIPSNLAYGERGTSGIPANSPLIFTVELLEVK